MYIKNFSTVALIELEILIKSLSGTQLWLILVTIISGTTRPIFQNSTLPFDILKTSRLLRLLRIVQVSYIGSISKEWKFSQNKNVKKVWFTFEKVYVLKMPPVYDTRDEKK